MSAHNHLEGELAIRLDEKIPEINDDQRLKAALSLAKSAKATGASAAQTAEALMILGLEENPLVGSVLDRHGHVVPPIVNSRTGKKVA